MFNNRTHFYLLNIGPVQYLDCGCIFIKSYHSDFFDKYNMDNTLTKDKKLVTTLPNTEPIPSTNFDVCSQ